MKRLFICSTPLQLMNIINLRLTVCKDGEAILYLYNQSQIFEELFQKVIATKLFTEVLNLDTTKFNKRHWSRNIKFMRYMINTFNYINHKHMAQSFINDSRKYDEFWVSTMDRSSWLFFMTYKKRNPLLELNFFEDGLGSYLLLLTTDNKIGKYLTHILGFPTYLEAMKKLYVYNPKVCLKSNENNTLILKMPNIDENKELDVYMNDIFQFDFKKVSYLSKKSIFLDQPFPQKDNWKNQEKIILHLSNKLKDRLYVKMHPRSQKYLYPDCQIISDITVPMEYFYVNSDIENNTLISVFSTACLSPFFMFNKEPRVIFLYKIIGLDKKNDYNLNFIKFIEKIQNNYKQKDRFLIPRTLDELDEIFDKIGE